MIYEGSAAVTSEGKSVQVSKGMGSIVEVAKPPSEPEPLLPALRE